MDAPFVPSLRVEVVRADRGFVITYSSAGNGPKGTGAYGGVEILEGQHGSDNLTERTRRRVTQLAATFLEQQTADPARDRA